MFTAVLVAQPLCAASLLRGGAVEQLWLGGYPLRFGERALGELACGVGCLGVGWRGQWEGGAVVGGGNIIILTAVYTRAAHFALIHTYTPTLHANTLLHTHTHMHSYIPTPHSPPPQPLTFDVPQDGLPSTTS